MAKAKVTPGQPRRCPMCTFVTKTGEEYRNHVLECAMRTFNCTYCSYSSNKEINVKRHEKRSHPGLLGEPIKLDSKSADRPMEATVKKQSALQEPVSDSEDWLKQDYGDVIGEVSASDQSDSSSSSDDESEERKEKPESKKTVVAGDKASETLLEGRIIRKQTVPTKPHTPKLKNPIAVASSKPECARQDASVPGNKRKVETADASTQTEASQRIVTTKRTKRFRQNEMDIEEIEEERFFFFDI